MTVFGPYAEWIRGQRCAACASPPRSQPHHKRSRGRGGQDEENLVPLCTFCHYELHFGGPSKFEAKHKVKLDELTSSYWSEYRKETDGE
jgi:hypothetical protein